MLQTDNVEREQELREWLRSAGITDDKPSYRPEEIWRLLDISRRTLYRCIADGRIRTVALECGDRTLYRIPRSFLYDLIDGANLS